MAYNYPLDVVLNQIRGVIRWLSEKADAAGSSTTQVSGIDCKVAADMVTGLLAEVERQRAVIAEQQAQITAMRPIVEAVAEARWGAYPSGEHLYGIGDAFRLRAQARAFVAAHPAPAESEAE